MIQPWKRINSRSRDEGKSDNLDAVSLRSNMCFFVLEKRGFAKTPNSRFIEQKQHRIHFGSIAAEDAAASEAAASEDAEDAEDAAEDASIASRRRRSTRRRRGGCSRSRLKALRRRRFVVF